MKSIVTSILFTLSVNANLFAQSGWFAQTSGVTDHLHSVYFTDANTGWAVGGDIILKTTNGGTTWSSQTISLPNASSMLLESVYFTDANIGWAVGGVFAIPAGIRVGVILKTIDGGTTWVFQTAAVDELKSVYFVDSNTGWAVGDRGSIVKTTDGGATRPWPIQQSGTTNHLHSVYFVDSNTGWVVAEGGRILKTTNGGTTWSSQTISLPNTFLILLESIYFIDGNIGWAVGSALSSGGLLGGIIFKTTNGGTTWVFQTTAVPTAVVALESVYFSDTNTGWAVGGIGAILKTADGGVTQPWPFQQSGTTNDLYSVYFVDSNTGWVVGRNGTILKTTTGGVVVSVEESQDLTSTIPNEYELSQNYPNPFNPSTTIEFGLPKAGYVTLKVYNIRGEEIATLKDGNLSAGRHTLEWNASGFASGVYFYRLQAGSFVETKKLLTLK